MSYEEALKNRKPKQTAVDKLDEYIASLTEKEAKALIWMLENETYAFCLEQLENHEFVSSKDTLLKWRRAHNVI